MKNMEFEWDDEDRYIVIGSINGYLTVVTVSYTPRSNGTVIRIISARVSTKEELSQFKRVSDLVKHERRESRKQNVTLRLSPNAIKKAKALGKGYTSILAKIIEKDLDNPALTEQLIK